MLFFFALIWAPAKVLCELGEGRMRWCTHLYCAAAVLLCRIVPKWLSTEVFHSVENLHTCDFMEAVSRSLSVKNEAAAGKFL